MGIDAVIAWQAYTKGRGDGLGFEFGRCEFELGEEGRGSAGQAVQFATVTVDGKPLPQWRFYIQVRRRRRRHRCGDGARTERWRRRPASRHTASPTFPLDAPAVYPPA